MKRDEGEEGDGEEDDEESRASRISGTRRFWRRRGRAETEDDDDDSRREGFDVDENSTGGELDRDRERVRPCVNKSAAAFRGVGEGGGRIERLEGPARLSWSSNGNVDPGPVEPLRGYASSRWRRSSNEAA